MKLSEIIKQYRENHEMSQRQFGALCGLSTGYISLIEKEINPQTGKKMVPSLPVINKIATGMGITIDELLSLCDDMDVPLNEKDIFSAPHQPTDSEPSPTKKRFNAFAETLSDEQMEKVMQIAKIALDR